MSAECLKTPLHALHLEFGARMVPFAGYDMPVQYRSGILSEHRQVRESAGLFDVSHMGQLRLIGDGAAAALEAIVPVDVQGLAVGQQRYAFFTNARGGILDDLMITRRTDDIFLVVNAACKAQDIAHVRQHLQGRCAIEILDDRALLALQGPKAVTVLSSLNPGVSQLRFMSGATFSLAGASCFVTRSGYTGEDGFEISVPAAQALALTRQLLAHPAVEAIGLGARDTLRLEAGLCLYGHDISEDTTPLEAGLGWAIQKIRRPEGARAGGYPGAEVLADQWAAGCARRRVGLIGTERSPVREGTSLVDAQGHALGIVCSGTWGPTVNQPIAMAYLPITHAAPGTSVWARVRDKSVPMTVTPLPFTPHRYVRQP